MRASARIFTTALALALCSQAHGQEAPGSLATPDLRSAIEIALKDYPTIAIALKRQEAAESGIDVARAEYFPRVDLIYQANRGTVNNVTGTLLPQSVIPAVSGPVLPETGKATWNSGAGVLVSWQPFDFGARGAGVNAARARASAAQFDVELSRIDVEFATTQAYLNLAAAQRLEAVALANLERLGAFRTAVEVLVENKLRAGVEGELARSAYGMAEASLVEARRNVAARQATLERLIGQRWGNSLLPLPAIKTAALAAGTPASHPAAKRQEAVADAEALETKAIKRTYGPSIALIGGASLRGTGKSPTGTYLGSDGLNLDTGNWAAGVQISFPLGSLPQIRARAAQQSANAEAERLRLRQTLAEVEERQAQADAAVLSARELIRVAPAARAAAALALAQQRERFKHGLVSTVEVSAAAAALAQAEAQAALAEIELVRALADQAASRGDMTSFHAAIGG